MLQFLGKNETAMVLTKLDKGYCNIHIGRKALAHMLLKA